MKSTLRGTVAKAIGMAAVLAAATSMTGVAIEPGSDTPNVGNIQEGTQGTVTIFKHKVQTGKKTEGHIYDESDTIGDGGIEGVVFKYFPVKKEDGGVLKLTGTDANANWSKLGKVTDTNLKDACAGVTEEKGQPKLAGFTFGEGKPMTATDNAGKSTVNGLEIGAYLFCEVKTPKTPAIVGKAAPMLVTIPRPDMDSDKVNKWHYKVTVYPKNSTTGISKTVKLQETAKVALGEKILWPVEADIPVLESGEHLTHMVIVDPMGDSRIKDRAVESVYIGEEKLTLNEEYKVTVNDATANKEYVAVGLTKKGLVKAEAAVKADPTAKLKVEFSSTLKAIGDGILKNKAKLYVNKTVGDTPPDNPPVDIPPGDHENPPAETPEVESHWGNLKLQKIDADTATAQTKKALAGAEFEIYSLPNNKAYPTSENDCKSLNDTTDATLIQINGANTVTTNSQGEIVIPGLFVSDDTNDPMKNKQFRCYLVKETKAPAGFVLPQNNVTGVAVKIGGVASGSYDTVIPNKKTTVPDLPLTGGSAQVVLPIAGLLLVAGGVFSAVAYRRRKENQ